MVTEDGERYEGLYERRDFTGLIITLVEPADEKGRFNLHEVFTEGDQSLLLRENLSPKETQEIIQVREDMGIPTRHI